MEFSEKLTKLLLLTETQNAVLAKAMNVDKSQISRMRTGARGMPTRPEVVRDMADYFAAHCFGEYKRNALAALTRDIRLQVSASEKTVSDAIFDWLSFSGQEYDERVDRFLKNVGSFSLRTHEDRRTDPGSSGPKTENEFVIYRKNAGKRQAVKDFISLIGAVDKPEEIWIFSDENAQWMYDDPDFSGYLGSFIKNMVEKGWHFKCIE